ncbi:maleylacetate reductase [Lineolata rhizophorae]|uniref:Maleylacetate reductase n=1 Tax=Lineolata rhizophorae TaxID=578093 RepID=A0A6A6NRJ0_9PEZI|nr:maleylacetate reductase [Lineolata rhizophorae]
MSSFEYNGNPSRVIFGSGSIQKLPAELARQKLSSPIIVSTPEQTSHAELVRDILSKAKDGPVAAAGIYSKAAMHTPAHVTEDAVAFSKKSGADSVVSIGGGSTTGLGKAISFLSGIPHVVIPTTYAGSEVTPVLGETKDGKKTTKSDPKILPGTVIYDVDLTMSLPPGLSATSGVNAIAHAVETLYSRTTSPITNLFAIEGISALANSLPIITSTDASDVPARTAAQYGAWLCGVCLGTVGMALHHKLCHALGGSFNMPHAETHTVVLPHALAYNVAAMPDDLKARLAGALPGSDGDPVKGLNVLLTRLGVKRGLKEFGLREEDVDRAAEIATSNPYWNPRPVEREKIRELIRRAWAGEEARADL